MEINPIKAFSDNYIWVIESDNNAAIVDPGEANGVMEYLEKQNLNLGVILLTHNHDDHTGGVPVLLAKYPDAQVYGPIETDAVATKIVQEGDSFDLFGHKVEVFKTAGHTEQHISYLMDDALFCGDALFSGGCGRVFTKDYAAQYDALQKFNQLADDVKVYAGHEYTQTNLRFAMSETPSNPEIVSTLHEVNDKRALELPTLPSTIGKEKKINLFLLAESLDKFIELRNARDEF